MSYQKHCPGCFANKEGQAVCTACGYDESLPRSPLLLPHGSILAEQYRVGRVLGRPGGFGITYLGWDIHLQQRMAIKEYLPRDMAGRGADGLTVTLHSPQDRSPFEAGREQFLREARIVAKLDHPNVVRVRSFFNANGTAYLVMDYYEGMSLGDYLATVRSVLEPGLAVGLMEPLLEGLAYVHGHGVVHRDIKPHNIYLASVGKPILLDFGAARQAAGDRAQSLSVVLTEGYAPLEQYQRRAQQGPWTDLYGIGATLFRMITGQAPPMALDRIGHEALEAPGWAEVPPELRAILERALAVRPADRYQSAEAFIDDLRRWRLGQAPAPRPARSPTPAPEDEPETPTLPDLPSDDPPTLERDALPGPPPPRVPEEPRARRTGSLAVLLAGGLAVALLALIARWLFPQPPVSPPVAAPPPVAPAALPPTLAGLEPEPPPDGSPTRLPRPAGLVLPEMARIPAGRWALGAQGERSVSLPAFEIGQYEVTAGDFRVFVQDQRYTNPLWAQQPCSGAGGRDWTALAATERHPVVCLSAQDALAYAAWLSAITGATYRLPTADEWEAAARGRRSTPVWWGVNLLEPERANCAGCSPFRGAPVVVGSYPANPFGLFDTAGNVREWTCTGMGEEPGATSCLDGLRGDLRLLLKGGSWNQPPERLAAFEADHENAFHRDTWTGFRLVRVSQP